MYPADPVHSLVDFLHQFDADSVIPLDNGGYYWAGVEFNPCVWLDHHLEQCRAFSEDGEVALLLGVYHNAISIRLHSKLMSKRSPSEAWVVQPFDLSEHDVQPRLVPGDTLCLPAGKLHV